MGQQGEGEPAEAALRRCLPFIQAISTPSRGLRLLVAPLALTVPTFVCAQTGHKHHHPAAPPAQAPAAGTVEEVLDLDIPDVALDDQDGNPVRFYTDLVKGKTVMANFIFTSCTTIRIGSTQV